MNYLYKNNIYNLLDKNIKDPEDLISSMVEMFYSEVISDADKKLLNTCFKEDITQEDLNSFIENWDIEVHGGAKSLMLSYMMKYNPHLQFSDYDGPRLKGLFNYHRYSNLRIISHFTKIVRDLNQKGITPAIVKGGAMKYMRQDLPRVMGDIDIITLGKDFDVACDLAAELGYEFGIDSSAHSVDLHPAGQKNGAVDIHRFIDFETDYNKNFMQEIFNRGSKVKAFSADVILPCPEDLMFVGLSNLAKNLHNKTSSNGILYMLFDAKYLASVKNDFDWNIVVENAKKTNTQVPIYFALRFLDKLVPGIVPCDIFDNKTFEKNIRSYCNEVIYFRFHVHDLKMRCKKLKIKKALVDWVEFKQYAKDKPKHFVLKRLRKRPFLVDLYLKIFGYSGK